jgi:single-strand DNA-binding protein
MKGMLQTTAVGNIGKDAELRAVGDSHACNFSVGVNLSYRDKNGNNVERTEWVRCVIWGKFAEAMAPHLKKGVPVFVQGEPHTREYQVRDGVTRYSVDVYVDKIVLLPSQKRADSGEQRQRGDGYGQPAGRQQQRRQSPQNDGPPGDDFGYDIGGGDDIPF